jgi:hypothetical protein
MFVKNGSIIDNVCCLLGGRLLSGMEIRSEDDAMQVSRLVAAISYQYLYYPD